MHKQVFGDPFISSQTELELLQARAKIEELQGKTQIDALTQLPNRRWLDEALPSLLEEFPGQVGLVFLDIDGLKEANDVLGHAQGDELIQRTGRTIYDSLRKKPGSLISDDQRPLDLLSRGVTRYAGDEFVTVLVGVKSQAEVETVIERIEQNLNREGIRASMGGLIHTGEKPGELLEKADTLMYAAKLQRKHEAYTPEQHQIIRQLGSIAAKNGINLRDVPPLLSLLEDQNS